MTWVKVCGLTDAADIEAVVAAGADALGFVNITASPRHVTLEQVARLAAGVPIHTILLTIDLAPDQAIAALERVGVDGIQPYGEHAGATAAAALKAGYVVLNPRRADVNLDLSSVAGIPLLDTPAESSLGGTGETFDWAHAADLKTRFVLAGGLGPDNVATAVRQVGPWGVDASSRLEKSPGRKDHGMVADFIAKAKNT